MSGIMNMLLGAKTAIAVAVDEFFNRVTLLLPGNGTNGAQNNTFLDSSTNNFTITRNGNTTQGTFSPFSQTGWSNYFSSSAYLSSSNNITQTGNFTVEGWVYTPSRSAANAIFTIGNEASGRIIFYINSSNQLVYSIFGVGDTNLGGTVPTESWVHVAFVRSSTTVTAYINGVATGTTGTLSGTVGNSSAFYIAASAGGSNALTGYISNVRVTNAALYTSTFTPSTTPLTTTVSTGAVALLTCQSNRFIDNSTNNFTLTANGSPSVQPFSPFAPTSAYSAATVGGSGYFDGTGDNLSSASGSSTALGSGDFTVECWYYQTAAGVYGIFGNLETNSDLQWAFVTANTSGTVRFQGWNTLFLTATEPPRNQWNHIAVSRSGTTMSMFLNGTRVATATNSTNFSATTNITVGGTNGTNNFLGYISNARVVKGSAVYDPTQTSITVPTAPLTAITNTQFLTNFTNAGITDATAKNDLETIGNAQISTTQSKFGGSSMYFDGNGDYLTVQSSGGLVLLSIPSGMFTVEMWIYRLGNGSDGTTAYDAIVGSNNGTSSSWGVYVERSTSKIGFYIGGSLYLTSSTITNSSWTHIAIARDSGNNMQIFINGVSGYSASNTGTSTLVNPLRIANDGTGQNHSFYGYIDDFRITRGQARYTANFTAPTVAFPLQ